MGEFVTRNATGSFYLMTTNQSPFFLKSNKTAVVAADPMDELLDYPSLKAMAVSGTPGFVEQAGAFFG